VIAISSAPLVVMRPAAQLIAQDGQGKLFTVSLADGEVLSCQPDGTFQTRPSGTNGPWELCTLSGNYLTFNPAGVPFTFAYVASVPNG
jgi:hypothetical protein